MVFLCYFCVIFVQSCGGPPYGAGAEAGCDGVDAAALGGVGEGEAEDEVVASRRRDPRRVHRVQ